MGKHKEKSHKRKHEDSDSASDHSGVQYITQVDIHLTFCRDGVRGIALAHPVLIGDHRMTRHLQ